LQLWQRNFLAVWPTMFALSAGLMAVLPTLPLYIEERYGIDDPAAVRTWAGLVYAVAPLSAAVFGPIWGALGDRVGRRPMVVRASFAIAVSSALLPLAPSLPWMVALRLVQGMFAGYVAPAMALVSADAPAEIQGRLLARLQLAMALGLLLGPAIGAEVSALWSRRAVFHVTTALATLATLIVACFARENTRVVARRDGRLFDALVLAPLGLLRSQGLAALLLLILMMRLGSNMVEPYIALWVRELGPLSFLGGDGGGIDTAVDRTTALMFTILAIAQLLFTTRWGRFADRYGALRCLAIEAIAAGVLLAVTSQVASIGQYVALRCLLALFLAGAMSLAYASVTRRIDVALRGTAFAMVQSCIQFGLALGPMLGGAVSRHVGLRGLFGVAAVTLAASGVGMLVLRARVPGMVPTEAAPTPEEA
jgi:MFS family permease